MRKRNNVLTDGKILVGIEELQVLLSIGKDTARRIGEESGAVVKIGRRTLYRRDVIEKYFATK